MFRLSLDDLRYVHSPFSPALSGMPGRLPEKVPYLSAQNLVLTGSSHTSVLLDQKSLVLSAKSKKAKTAPDGQHETFLWNVKKRLEKSLVNFVVSRGSILIF